MEHDFIKSKKQIKDVLSCLECPLSLANKDKKIIFGIGNTASKTVFILPYYDNNNPKNIDNDLLEYLKEAYTEITGKSIYEENYITPLPKCYNKKLNKYKAYDTAKLHCIFIILTEIKHYCTYCNKIVFCDKKLFDLFEDYFTDIFPSNSITYIPNIKQFKTNHKVFINKLTKIIND